MHDCGLLAASFVAFYEFKTRDKLTRAKDMFLFQDCWGPRTQPRDQTSWLAKA